MTVKWGNYAAALKAIWEAFKAIPKSNPPDGYEKITNFYWDPINEKIVAEHEA